MSLNASTLGLANRGTGSAGTDRLSPRYWELMRKASLRRVNPSPEKNTTTDLASLPKREPATKAQPTSQAPLYNERKATRGAIFGPPVAMRVGERILNLSKSKWPQEDIAWEGAALSASAGAAVGLAFPGKKTWDSGVPETETSARHGIVRYTASVLYPIMVISAVTIATFSLLYWISNSLQTQVVAPLQVQDYFFFSLRSFLTFSTVDTAPATSLGRFFTSVEGLMGYTTMLWFAIKVGQLTTGKES